MTAHLALPTALFVLALLSDAGAADVAKRKSGRKEQTEHNNWAVLVSTSRYWYNYRHSSNVLSFYHTLRRLGIPDSQIILMIAEDAACNPRNSRPGTVFGEMHHKENLYGEEVEVDYRGDEVSVENFIRLLTGRHPPSTPRNKRLLSDSTSNVFIYITGHSGEEFIKFQDWEEITSNDIADAFAQMHKQRRYREVFWVSDTCQAATLQNQFYSPGILAIGSSGKKENSYSHHVDPEIGVAVIDRFTYYAYEGMQGLTTTSQDNVRRWLSRFNPRDLHATPEMREDLFTKDASDTLLTEFLATTGRMRFQNGSLDLTDGSSLNSTPPHALCGAPADAQEMEKRRPLVGDSSSSSCIASPWSASPSAGLQAAGESHLPLLSSWQMPSSLEAWMGPDMVRGIAFHSMSSERDLITLAKPALQVQRLESCIAMSIAGLAVVVLMAWIAGSLL